LTLLEGVLDELRAECERGGRGATFESLKGYLGGENTEPYAKTATALGTSESAVKAAVHRLRRRYRDLLRLHIADTVDTAADVDEEIRDLFAALDTRW
jgi:RNA polymerase sigma-70 factor (ECF subfamily)